MVQCMLCTKKEKLEPHLSMFFVLGPMPPVKTLTILEQFADPATPEFYGVKMCPGMGFGTWRWLGVGKFVFEVSLGG